MASVIQDILRKELGAAAESVDETILEYMCSMLEDQSLEDGDVVDMLAPLLLDSGNYFSV